MSQDTEQPAGGGRRRLLIDVGPLRRSRDLRWLVAGELISILGNQLTTVAVPVQVYQLTRSSLDVGLASLAQLFPLIAGALLGGSAVDAMDRRRLLLAAQLAAGCCSVGLAVNADLGPARWPLFVFPALSAGFSGLDSAGRSAIVPNLVRRSEVSTANAIFQALFQFGLVAGPAVAGLLLAGAGVRFVYWLDVASFAVAGIAVFTISPQPPAGEHGHRPGLRSILEGLRFVRGRQAIQGAYLIDINAMVFGMPRALFPALASTVFGGGAATVGFLYAAPGAGALVGALTTGWVSHIRRQGRASLWLLTLQRNRPFTFLNHAIRCGDSLLGVTRPEQIESFDLLPREHEEKQLTFWQRASKVLFERALQSRLKLESFPVLSAIDLERKEALLREAEDAMSLTGVMCDLLIGAAIATATGKRPEEDESFVRKRAELWRQLMQTYQYDESVNSWRSALESMQPVARALLDTGLPSGSSSRRPFHWPLEFPEVFVNRDGFDVIVGNPPFIGGQRITGVLGQSYRDYLVEYIAGGTRGSSDYVAYFFLRAEGLLKSGGTAGLLATNTIAQGDTREVGLDQMVGRGDTIYRAIPSRRWPGEASLEVAHIWFRKGTWTGPFVLEDQEVRGITSQLRAPGRVSGNPYRLVANAGKSFQGSIVLGMGFVLQPDEAQRLLDKDLRNRDVLFPYLNGEDLNSRWDQSASRWVINFRDWPIERAMEYPDCFEIVERLVKPERDNNRRRVRRERWWQFAERASDLYATIAGLDRVLVRSQTSRTQAGSFVYPGSVYDQKLVVFATQQVSVSALLDAHIHYWWVISRGSTMRTDAVYTPSDCFDTFPFPPTVTSLEDVGDRYYSLRRDIMTIRREGLTATYNRFHSPPPHEVSHDIAALRTLHVEMDHAVAVAYGWTDLDLGHDFQQTRQGTRFTISESARREVLDRLLALNHERYAREQAAASTEPRTRRTVRKRATAHPQLF